MAILRSVGETVIGESLQCHVRDHVPLALSLNSRFSGFRVSHYLRVSSTRKHYQT